MSGSAMYIVSPLVLHINTTIYEMPLLRDVWLKLREEVEVEESTDGYSTLPQNLSRA